MNLCICGGRDRWLTPTQMLWLDQLLPKLGTVTLLNGGARGVDESARAWAEGHGIEVVAFPANWKRHGKAAGPIRNAEMAAMADLVIAFSGGRGTRSMVREAERRGVEVVEIS